MNVTFSGKVYAIPVLRALPILDRVLIFQQVFVPQNNGLDFVLIVYLVIWDAPSLELALSSLLVNNKIDKHENAVFGVVTSWQQPCTSLLRDIDGVFD